jgi:carbonic anhydrase
VTPTDSDQSARRTPAVAWQEMTRGNDRFVAGEPLHPRQDVERRAELAAGQAPIAALFGCSDSRLSAEIIFDKGIGDLFVIRNAGQVISESVVGSIEYAVAVLNVPLIVVLGHDSCGAVAAAIQSQTADAAPLPPHIAHLIAPIIPAVRRVAGADAAFNAHGAIDASKIDSRDVGREHLRDTISELLEASELISDAVAAGTLAIVGANYSLLVGRAELDTVIGSVESA